MNTAITIWITVIKVFFNGKTRTEEVTHVTRRKALILYHGFGCLQDVLMRADNCHFVVFEDVADFSDNAYVIDIGRFIRVIAHIARPSVIEYDSYLKGKQFVGDFQTKGYFCKGYETGKKHTDNAGHHRECPGMPRPPGISSGVILAIQGVFMGFSTGGDKCGSGVGVFTFRSFQHNRI